LRSVTRSQAESLLEDGAYVPVRSEAADFAIGPSLEQVFRREHIDIVDRLALGLTVDRFHFDISADLDTAILGGRAAEGNANFEKVTVAALVTTGAGDAEPRALQIETERRRPIDQLFARSGVDIQTTWTRAD